jgi:plastocyanin
LLFVVPSCGGAALADRRPPTATHAVQMSDVTIPGGDRFSPFVTVVSNGSQVTFHNGDADAHSVVSVPGDVQLFNKILEPGESWTVTLVSAGTHRYFCSIHAQFDGATGQVRALPGADHPDEPMEGVVVVR